MKNYYNRFDLRKKYDRTLFLSGRGLQSAELNEIQDTALDKLKGIGDAILKDGNVIEGASIRVDADTGATHIEAGKVYLRGAVRSLSDAHLTIPTNAQVKVGVYYQESTITELEDPSLRDPAVGTRNYQEPGAARLQVSLSWGFEAAGVTPQDRGAFYPVYTVENGIVLIHAPPPQLDSVTTALARYDRESNGSYIVSGLSVHYLESVAGEQVFVINEGKAHVDGFEIELSHGMRVRFPEDPDIGNITSEPHNFTPDENGVMRLQINNGPLHKIDHVDITREKTVEITHGSFTGAIDPLPDESVLDIVEITQGQTRYENNQDYQLTAGDVDWSLSGAEPSPGSTYQITYRYRATGQPENIEADGFAIQGAVAGSLILVDYQWKLPRFDLVTLDHEGSIRRVKGLAHPWRPAVPMIPQGQLSLASLAQNWRTVGTMNTAIHAISMSDIEAMRQSIHDLYDLVAQERLRNDANAQDPAVKRGMFVDPFLDDDLRDQGLPQSAAIVDGELTLPINGSSIDLAREAAPLMLDYELEPVIEQLLRTSAMKVNPYQAFDPIPASVVLNLAVDRWTEIHTQWASPMTQRFSRLTSPLTQNRFVGSGNASRLSSRSTQNVLLRVETSENNELLSTGSQAAVFMRQVPQTFTLEGFEAGEELTLVFDGVEIETRAIETREIA